MPSARPSRSQSGSQAKKSGSTRTTRKQDAQAPSRRQQTLNSIIDKAIEKGVDGALDAIANGAGLVGPKFAEMRDQRRAKRDAEDLARTLGENYIEIPLVNSEHRRHYVVFRDGKPFRAFPALEGNLADVEELHGQLPKSSFREPRRIGKR